MGCWEAKAKMNVDRKGAPCHGPQDKMAAGTCAMFAPCISEDLLLRVQSLLYEGVSVETIMQSHVFFYEDYSDVDHFTLGIQTEWQLQQMIRFGNRSLIASDSRIGTTKLKYPVHSLLVFNEDNKAIPVAWIVAPKDVDERVEWLVDKLVTKMASWDEIMSLPVQSPPALEFSSSDLVWSKVEGWRDKKDRVALIPFPRVDDFLRGECSNKECPTRFHVEARQQRQPKTPYKPKTDGILECILYWCSFGPDDHMKGRLIRPSRINVSKRNALRPNTKKGCTCHFIVKRLIDEPSGGLIIYNQDKHVDRKGVPCQGPLLREPRVVATGSSNVVARGNGVYNEVYGEEITGDEMNVDPSSICISPPGLLSVDEVVSSSVFSESRQSHDIEPVVIFKTSVESQVVEAAETPGVITENDRMETENKNRSTINDPSSADDAASIDGPRDNLVNASDCSLDSKAVGNMMVVQYSRSSYNEEKLHS
ncbi:hypothetical protein C1H46_030135 [Malus baccata]|uniref:Uncharacterized protein n=1 Tax=Malus baccata TaxID=106549 RepID=A0A540LCU7_MALBA|nr:hypothetical protein C1H46_030135 [Malus baccata]